MRMERFFGNQRAHWLRLVVLVFAATCLASVGAMAYSISGTVTVCGGPGLRYVTVTAGGRTATTDYSGAYTITGLNSSSYTVTPSRSGYTFSPTSQPVTIKTSNVTGVDFIAQPTGTQRISGRVRDCNGDGMGGVTVSLNTGQTAVTGPYGSYTIYNVPASCTPYTVTPSLSGFTFSPPSQSVIVITSTVSGIDFTGSSSNLSISGSVTVCGGSGVSGVTVTLVETGATVTTDANGAFTFGGLSGCTTYTVTAALAGSTITPSSQSVALGTSNVTGVSFLVQPGALTISGIVTHCDGSGISGVTVTTDSGLTATTDTGGKYTITNVAGDCSGITYVVTPSLSGYTFVPTSQSVVVTGSPLVNVNFSETPPAGTFSISGTVTGCSGSGMSGVAVQANTGQAATTDSSGNYTLTGLAPCTIYTITPRMSGYSFTPGSQSVPVAGQNVTGVNFSGTGSSVGSWDPLKQVSQQVVRPNLLIVQDVSGSMVWDINAKDVGVDSTGTNPTATWTAQYWSTYYNSWRTCTGCTTTATQWRYVLDVHQKFPSRIATVKNALGNSVDIITPWQAPDNWTTDTAFSYITTSNAAWAGGTISGPSVSHSSTDHNYTWTVTFPSAQSAPDIPFTAYDANGVPTVGSGGLPLAAQDLVGRNANNVNWGLETFSGDYGNTLVSPIDSNDTGIVSGIETAMQLYQNGGLNVSGGTPTRGALTFAGSTLASTYANDPKSSCGRTYGVVLVTDGLSNTGNPDDGDWISPCGACPGQSCCDTGSSGFNCPDNYTAFPAGVSESLWNMTAPAHIRTWAIGISYQVNRCEMNMDAYMGRTDATSPNGDAGFATASDPYLPTATGDTAHYQPNVGSHGDYAYFATTAQALGDAFTAIVAAAATGDYSTAAPVVSSSISGGSDIVYVASAEYPAWKGHFYAYDEHDPSNPVLDWDAGKMLAPPWTDAQGVTRGRNLVSNPRVIYTWDSNGNLVDLGAYTHVSQLPSTLTLPAGFTDSVLDYLKGFDGTDTNTQRAWILGPVLNSTAAVFSAPEAWKPNSLPDHKAFESTYATRHPLVMVGSSDGMLHVFDVADGYEVYAILPPDQLANQPLLFNNYRASRGIRVTGEPLNLGAHIYGVAASPRFADVYMSSDSQYHTVLLLTEGKGGNTIAAIDVTHSYPGRTGVVLPYKNTSQAQDYGTDPNCDTTASPSGSKNYTSLIQVIWSKNSSSLSGLGQTWSVPAVGATSSSPTFDAILGSGYGGCSNYTPSLFSLNMQDGSAQVSSSLTNASTHLVQNQSYGAGVLFGATATVPKNYDVQNLGVIADTNGRVWFVVPSTGSVVKAIDLTGSQPIYYTPAAAYYSGKDIYAFASGNFYETSSAVTGSSSTFVPTLYLVAKSADATAANASTDIYSLALSNVVVDPTHGTKLHASSQVTADPVLFLPSGPNRPVKAFFLVYDPQAGTCVGTSYLIELDAPAVTGSNWKAGVTQTSQSLGSGVASGFAFSGGKIIVARSAIGSGQVTPQVAGTGPNPLGEAPTLSSWIELK